MHYLKVFCSLGVCIFLASNVWSMSRWSEARGVYDDVCYLRQAHLFQNSWLGGLDTNISRDDDLYLSSKLKEIGFPTWSDATTAPCHNLMPETKKLVMQYPPGTGFVLGLFPQGFQVIPLYVIASVIVFGFALAAIAYASTIPLLILATIFGDAAIYLMINPAKASYSMAPTMVVCALAGFLTAHLFMKTRQNHRASLTIFIGFLIGLAVNFRLPNLFFRLDILCSSLSHSYCPGKSRPPCKARCSEQHFWQALRRRCSPTRSMPAVPSRRLTEVLMWRPAISASASSGATSRTCNSFCLCSRVCGPS
jgi:hypothetical protein